MRTLGCYLSASQMVKEGKKYITGPMFTEHKVNEMGWRLDSVEAERMASSAVGKPVRYCSCGSAMLGVAKEHSCDVQNDQASIIATVEQVYKKITPGGVVWYADAKVKDGVDVDTLPSGWSVFGGADSRDQDGYVHNTGCDAISLTTHPAYSEAQTRIISASGLSDTISNINTPSAHSNPQSIMIDGSTSTPVGTVATPNTTATTPPVNYTTTPSNTTTYVYTPPTVTKEELDAKLKQVQDGVPDEKTLVERVRNELRREDAAKDIVSKMLKSGVLTDDKADAKFTELRNLDMNSLDIIKSNMELSTPKPRPEAGVADAPLANAAINQSGANRPLEEGEKVWIKRLGLTEDIWRKHNPELTKGR